MLALSLPPQPPLRPLHNPGTVSLILLCNYCLVYGDVVNLYFPIEESFRLHARPTPRAPAGLAAGNARPHKRVKRAGSRAGSRAILMSCSRVWMAGPELSPPAKLADWLPTATAALTRTIGWCSAGQRMCDMIYAQQHNPCIRGSVYGRKMQSA